MKTVHEEPTLISPPTQFAGVAIRLKALACDYLLISAYIFLLAAVSMAVIKISGVLGLSLRWPENPVLADLMAFITLILPVSLYFALSESSRYLEPWAVLIPGRWSAL